MGNETFFFAGYAIKGHRKMITNEIDTAMCCGQVMKTKYCSNCGEKKKIEKKVEKGYPTAFEFIPDNIADEFFDELDIIYHEGHVSGLKEGECYLILNKKCHTYDDWFVEKVEIKSDDIKISVGKYLNHLTAYMTLDDPEMIVAVFGEW